MVLRSIFRPVAGWWGRFKSNCPWVDLAAFPAASGGLLLVVAWHVWGWFAAGVMALMMGAAFSLGLTCGRISSAELVRLAYLTGWVRGASAPRRPDPVDFRGPVQ